MQRNHSNNWQDVLNLLKVSVGAATILIVAGCSSPLKYEPRAIEPSSSVQSISAKSELSQSPNCLDRYQIQRGDTLSGIAQRCNVSLTLLTQTNQIYRPDKIYVGQWLKIPQVLKQSVQAKKSESKDLIAKNVQHNQNPNWLWPVKSTLPYQWNRSGAVNVLQVMGSAGEPIHSIAAGQVEFVGRGIDAFGVMVIIRHHRDFLSVYAHTQTPVVSKGEKVVAGQPIAEIGTTGNTITPKLHLELRQFGRKIDLKKYLSAPSSAS